MADPKGLVTGIAAGGSLLGGLAGLSDSRERERFMMRMLQSALGAQQDRGRAVGDAFRAAEPYMDELLEVASGLTDDLLGQTDPITAAEVRRIRQQQEAEQAAVQRGLVDRGLDSFTTRVGATTSVNQAGSNAMNDLAARMSSLRQSAVGAGTSAEIGALGARGQFEVDRGLAIGDVFNSISQIYNQQQVAPSTAARDVGQFTSLILDAALADFGQGDS